MAINPISLAESLRPLKAAGLSCFLDVVFSPSDNSEEFGSSVSNICEESGTAAARSLNAPAHNAGGGRVQALSEQGAQAHRGQSTFGQRGQGANTEYGQGCATAQEGVRSPAANEKPPMPCADTSSGKFSLAPASWPAPWRALFAELRAAPVMWSYAELGLDLNGQGSTERSSTLRNIIGALQLPRGTSVFWPQSLPDDADSSEAGQGMDAPSPLYFFASGLELLSPKTVILLGCSEGLAKLLGFSNTAPYTQGIVKGRLYIHLPAMEQMLRDPQLVDRACIFLRNALTAYPSLFRQK